MKKILNKVEDLVVEMCEGMIKAHPTQLAFSKKFKVISRAQVDELFEKAWKTLNETATELGR